MDSVKEGKKGMKHWFWKTVKLTILSLSAFKRNCFRCLAAAG